MSQVLSEKSSSILGFTRRRVGAMAEDSNRKYFEPRQENLRLPSDCGAILSRQSSMLDGGGDLMETLAKSQRILSACIAIDLTTLLTC